MVNRLSTMNYGNEETQRYISDAMGNPLTGTTGTAVDSYAEDSQSWLGNRTGSVSALKGQCPGLGPTSCASVVAMNWLMLTPSRRARAATRACKDFGTRRASLPL